MSEQLRVSLVQAASGLEPAENRELLARTAAEVPDGTDLVVWPEAFARDFGKAGSDVSAHAETVWGEDGAGPGPFADAVAQVAQEHGATVVAGMFETSDDPARPWNTLAVAGPDGERASYRKIHLYDSFGYRESDRLSAGPTTPVTVEIGGFVLGLMTCYDLRFPEHARRLVDAGAEVLVLPAAWLAGPGKLHHWRTLLTARAIENTVFALAAAQPAPRYTGHSLAVDPMGRVLGEAGDEAGRVDVVLERSVLTEARETNPSLANRRL